MATTNERKIVGKANVRLLGEVFPDVEIAHITATNEYQGTKTVKKYYTTAPITEADIKPTDIRLYPLSGMNEDFETTIKPLFEGEVLELKGLTSKAGKSYNAKVRFDPDVVPSFLSKPYYKGNLEFMPRD